MRRGLSTAVLPGLLIGAALGACSSSPAPVRPPVGAVGATQPAPAAPSSVPTTFGPGTTAAAPPEPPATTAAPVGPCAGTAPPGRYDRVVWIWMENHTDVLASGAAAYERGVAAACGAGTNDADVGSPSLPNYLGATSGSTWGVGDDSGPGSHPIAADNLFRQVRAAGGTERSYEEAMPAPCTLGSGGRYAVKHNPAAYYVGGNDRAACESDDVPLAGAFAHDIAAGTLPMFSFVTPDLCDDTHDCGIGTGDAWLAQWLARVLDGPQYRDGRTAVFVVWDEPTPMAELVMAPSVVPGTTVTVRTDHYALLRTTEELLGLPLLGRAATAVDLRPLYHL